MKLSVIVPVYRVENTLDRCIESITGQSTEDMEVILVDDGSPDRCPQMCDDWARRDPRIRVIHKANGGLSDARNTGLDMAKGDLVTFVDSDDFLAPDTYEKVILTAQDNDVTEYPIVCKYGSERQHLLTLENQRFTDAGDYWRTTRGYTHSYACNKIYQHKLFEGIRFPKGRVFEDIATIPKLLMRAKKIATTPHGMYYYCQNDQGITASATGRELEMLLEGYLPLIDTWPDDRFYLHALNIQIDVYERSGKEPVLPHHKVSPLAKGLSATARAKALSLCCLGMKNTCKLNKVIHLWKKPRS